MQLCGGAATAPVGDGLADARRKVRRTDQAREGAARIGRGHQLCCGEAFAGPEFDADLLAAFHQNALHGGAGADLHSRSLAGCEQGADEWARILADALKPVLLEYGS